MKGIIGEKEMKYAKNLKLYLFHVIDGVKQV